MEMSFIIKLLLSILVAGAIGWFSYFYYQNKRMPSAEEFVAVVTQIPSLFSGKIPLSTSSLPKIDQNSQQAVTEAINEGKKRVDMVLGEAIEVASDSSKPAAQKAIDYGRYLYCQQVVEEYEKN